MNDPAFLWSDAWLFLAIGLAARAHPVSLAAVLPLADGIQHALPTKAEIDGALGRLSRAGFVHYGDGQVTVAENGMLLLQQAARTGRTLVSQQDALERLLPAPPWSAAHDPQAARSGESEAISDADWARLVASYRA